MQTQSASEPRTRRGAVRAAAANWSTARRARAAALAVILALGAGCAGPSPSVDGERQASADLAPDASRPALSSAATTDGSARVSASPESAPSSRPTSSLLPGGPVASSGAIAIIENNGSLSLVTASGRSLQLAAAGDSLFSFPAWSPDGSRIATVRSGFGITEIVVFDAAEAASGTAVEPVVIFRSDSIAPFYVAWTPDGRSVAFLAQESATVSLRVAPADGSAPLDGSGPRSKIRDGSALFFDWTDPDGVLAHIGRGPDAFLGVIGLDGVGKGPLLPAPGDFRSADVSSDGSLISYVRAPGREPAQVVVAARDGSNEQSMPVFGTAAVAFGPSGGTVASIGPTRAGQSSYTIPFGPLRLLDAGTGHVRTLIDDAVASFWWSPDGRTIGALQVRPASDEPRPASSPSSSASGSAASASPAAASTAAASPAAASPEGRATPSPVARSSASSDPSATGGPTEIHLVFVDVASGRKASTVVQPGRLYVDQFLTYFDQYARSHHVWSPDSSSILVPIVDADGGTRIEVLHRNGDPPITIDGSIGFWSP